MEQCFTSLGYNHVWESSVYFLNISGDIDGDFPMKFTSCRTNDSRSVKLSSQLSATQRYAFWGTFVDLSKILCESCELVMFWAGNPVWRSHIVKTLMISLYPTFTKGDCQSFIQAKNSSKWLIGSWPDCFDIVRNVLSQNLHLTGFALGGG